MCIILSILCLWISNTIFFFKFYYRKKKNYNVVDGRPPCDAQKAHACEQRICEIVEIKDSVIEIRIIAVFSLINFQSEI